MLAKLSSMSGESLGSFPPGNVLPPPAFDPAARAHGAEASSSAPQQDQQALLADKVLALIAHITALYHASPAALLAASEAAW